MIRWLYRYLFRGIGILLLVGMLTVLYLAMSSQSWRSRSRQSATKPAAPVSGGRP
jgi:hypothetical protein